MKNCNSALARLAWRNKLYCAAGLISSWQCARQQWKHTTGEERNQGFALMAFCDASHFIFPIAKGPVCRQIRAGSSWSRVWGGRQQVCRKELLPGATADPHVAADKGPIKRAQKDRAAARVGNMIATSRGQGICKINLQKSWMWRWGMWNQSRVIWEQCLSSTAQELLANRSSVAGYKTYCRWDKIFVGINNLNCGQINHPLLPENVGKVSDLLAVARPPSLPWVQLGW